jgi:hypothetical protein
MAESEKSVAAIALPPELEGQFEKLEGRLYKVESAALAAGCVAGLAGAYLLVFGSDRVWDSPTWLRGAAFAGGAAVVAWNGARWVKRWVLKRRTRKDLAELVQRKFGRLGDRLLGIVELSSEEKHQLGFSPELYRAAIKQVAGESAQYDFTEAVSKRGLNRTLRAAIGAGAVALVTLAVFPNAAINAAKRAAAPWANIERFTLVQLAGVPTEVLVPHGESFEVGGAVRYDSFWQPKFVRAKFGRVGATNDRVQNGKFALTIPGQTEEKALTIRVGDASAKVRVKPLLRPSLKNLDATVELPEYLKLGAREMNAQGGNLTVVEGSKAIFKGVVSRPLKKAEAIASDGAELPVKAEADHFTTAPVPVDNISTAEFRWQDLYGLTNQGTWKLAIQTQKDASPVPDLPDLSREMSILESEVVMIKVRARDDFGVKKVGLNWDLGTNTNAVPYDFSLEAESASREEFEQTFTFTPMLLQAQPDTTVAVRGFATDYFPGREPSETPSYRIHVLGTEQHAEMVRQRLESVMARLEEVSRLEEKIAQATAELQANEKMALEDAAKKAADLKDEQLQNAAALKDMAEEGMKNLREALKNPSFPEEVLTQWSKTLKQMKDLSEKPMQEAAKSLAGAAQPSAKSKEQKEQLAKAGEKEKDILQELEQMQKKINKGLDDLQALTLAQRLRKMGTGQKEIHTELEKSVQETIGMTPAELAPRFKKANSFLAEQQEDARQRATELQGEISRFFERTRKPNYGMVSKQMAEARTPEELDRIRNLIEGNISMQAMDTLNLWSGRFDEWANLLEPKQSDAGGDGGSGQGGPSEPDSALKELMALLRLREGQFNLRERTRMLDKDRRDEVFYKESAKKLHDAQAKLAETLDQVQNENEEQEVEPALREGSRSMQAVESMLGKPQTDEPVAVAHNRTLEKLSDAINLLNEKQKKAKDSSSAQGQGQGEEMAFLMQMMQQQNPKPGMQGGMKPGMNMNGGDTADTTRPNIGDANGKADVARTARKAGGSSASAPAEFREALENYYKALEKGEK